MLSPLVWFYTFFWFGVEPILIGAFPANDHIPHYYGGATWLFIVAALYFGVGPRFLISAEVRHRNKVGFYFSDDIGSWIVDDTNIPRAMRASPLETHTPSSV
jgi:hypothetical protein